MPTVSEKLFSVAERIDKIDSVFLDVPWSSSSYFLSQYSNLKRVKTDQGWLFVYTGDTLPKALESFVAKDFSLLHWLSDDRNNIVSVAGSSPVVFTPKKHQKEGAAKIASSYVKGDSGFLLADKTGLGKTLTTLVGLSYIAQKQGFNTHKKAKLLVVCPKSVIPQWRQTFYHYPVSTRLLRPLVINYQQLGKLLTTPEKAKKAKKARTANRAKARDGKPTVDWDFVVFDEAHYLKNYGSSTVSLNACNVAQLNTPYKKGSTPFVVFSTATPGSSPLNLAVMSQMLSPLLKTGSTGVTPALWGAFLEQQGFSVSKKKNGWTWAQVPWFGKNSTDPHEKSQYLRGEAQAKAKQRKDSQRIGKALLSKNAPFIMRSPKDIAGWPEQQILPMLLDLDQKQRTIYEEVWSRFRNWLKLTPAKADPKGALVETLRYRQKSSLLKVDSMLEVVKDYVDNGKQVYISVEFMETLDAYKEKLHAMGIPVCEISGRTTETREQERLTFQKGLAKVVLCTVVAGISLHANETLSDGKATPNERITILHDIRQNNLDTVQALGRAHRDGENSLAYIPAFEGTVDERVVESYVNKTANLSLMTGSSQQEVVDFEDTFRKIGDNF